MTVSTTTTPSFDELAQAVPLVRFKTLTLVRAGELRAAGSGSIRPGDPQHFTVAFDDLDGGVDALVSCEHLNWLNPYHER